jgi:hypothetical protein
MSESKLAAALQYAGRGWYVFPVPPGKKKGYVKGANGNGLRWGCTTDPAEIERYWARWPNANIGIATGAESGIFVVETDTPEGHGVDGAASLKELEAANGPLPLTLMAMSPTGSVHRYFRHPGGKVVSRSIAPGVDVKGDGGMVVAPPSTVPGKGSYEWVNHDPIA